MIEYKREEHQGLPRRRPVRSRVVGIGGAGSNALDQIALDGSEEAELVCLDADIRTLKSSTAHRKVQLGKELTKGLGAGGDPELGGQAAEEAEEQIREAVRGQALVFVCVGLGGGVGSGAAPLVCRVAKEEGAFVTVFATMPFHFEGRRRLAQADRALEELEAVADALMTFDNDRLGELALAKDGIQQAFTNADKVVSQSVRAVTGLVTQPGLIQIGMDDLLTALRNPTSRCLFGYGVAGGKNRVQDVLKQALRCPLLDEGRLLERAASVLVHVVGGPSLTLLEVEQLMEKLNRSIHPDAHILFGTGIDEKLGDRISLTVFSSLALTDLHPQAAVDDEAETEEAPPPVVAPVVAPVAKAGRRSDTPPAERTEDAAGAAAVAPAALAAAAVPVVEPGQPVEDGLDEDAEWEDEEGDEEDDEGEGEGLDGDDEIEVELEEEEVGEEADAGDDEAEDEDTWEEDDGEVDEEDDGEVDEEEDDDEEIAPDFEDIVPAAVPAPAAAEPVTAEAEDLLEEEEDVEFEEEEVLVSERAEPLVGRVDLETDLADDLEPIFDEEEPEEADEEEELYQGGATGPFSRRSPGMVSGAADRSRRLFTETASSRAPEPRGVEPAEEEARSASPFRLRRREEDVLPVLEEEEEEEEIEAEVEEIEAEEEYREDWEAPGPVRPSSAPVFEDDLDVVELEDEDEFTPVRAVAAPGAEALREEERANGELESPEAPGSELEAARPEAGAPAVRSEAPRGKRLARRDPYQEELELEPLPRGRFDKTAPTVVDGENLDIPTYLRKKLSR